MRFNVGPKKRAIDYEKWTSFFAWFPVHVENNLVWLEPLQFKCSDRVMSKSGRFRFKKQYRHPVPLKKMVEVSGIGRAFERIPGRYTKGQLLQIKITETQWLTVGQDDPGLFTGEDTVEEYYTDKNAGYHEV